MDFEVCFGQRRKMVFMKKVFFDRVFDGGLGKKSKNFVTEKARSKTGGLGKNGYQASGIDGKRAPLFDNGRNKSEAGAKEGRFAGNGIDFSFFDETFNVRVVKPGEFYGTSFVSGSGLSKKFFTPCKKSF